MTRTLTLRVTDDQFDWVAQRAEGFAGDLSATTRDCILAAQILYRILDSPDPHAELQKLLDESKAQRDREAFLNEFGYYPDETPA